MWCIFQCCGGVSTAVPPVDGGILEFPSHAVAPPRCVHRGGISLNSIVAANTVSKKELDIIFFFSDKRVKKKATIQELLYLF